MVTSSSPWSPILAMPTWGKEHSRPPNLQCSFHLHFRVIKEVSTDPAWGIDGDFGISPSLVLESVFCASYKEAVTRGLVGPKLSNPATMRPDLRHALLLLPSILRDPKQPAGDSLQLYLSSQYSSPRKKHNVKGIYLSVSLNQSVRPLVLPSPSLRTYYVQALGWAPGP